MNKRVTLVFDVDYCDSEITADKIAVQLQEFIDEAISRTENVGYFENCTELVIGNFKIESDELDEPHIH